MITLSAILLMLLCDARLHAAQTTPDTSPSAATAHADEHVAESAAAAFSQVIETRNIDPLADSIDPDFVGIMPTGETVHGFPGLKNYWDGLWNQLGKTGEFKVQIRLAPAQVLGNVALLHGNTDLILVYATGQQVRGTVAWSAVLRRVADRWKVIQAEGSINPMDNQFERTNFHTVIIIWSGLGLLVGMGLGIAGWRFWLTREPGSLATK